MSLLVFVFLSSVALSSSLSWFIGPDASDQDIRLLQERGCYKGTYQAVTLSNCAFPQSVFFTELSNDTSLCMLEAPKGPNTEEYFNQAQMAMSKGAEADTEVVYRDDEQRVMLVAHPGDMSIACAETFFSPGSIENAIFVPWQPWRSSSSSAHPLRTADPATLTANPTIANALAQVDKDRMYNNLDTLSNAYYTRNSYSAEAVSASNWLKLQYENAGLITTVYDFDGPSGKKYSPNIIAESRGLVEPERVVLVGAHYDSRSTDREDPTMRAPGADDNGSGTVVMLELAHLIQTLNLRFHYTVRICSWGGEEQGLVGSRAYAAEMAEKGEDLIVVFNADMLGYQLADQPITLGMKDRYISTWLLEVANSLTNLYVPSLPIGYSSSCCSDHQSFTENGYDAIGYFEHTGSASDYWAYHTGDDVIANINFEQLTLEAQAVYAAVLTFATPV